MDWTRKGSHPPCTGRRCERTVGSMGEDTRKASLEDYFGDDTGGTCAMY